MVPLGGFVLGVEGCRLLAARRPGRLMLLRDGLIGQAALLVVTTGLCAVAAGKPVGAIRYAVLAVAAVAMGGQNGLARRMGVNELTTTVMTGTVIALVSGRREREGRVASLRLTFSVVSLIAGALLGTAVVRVGHSTPALGLCAAIAVAVAVGASRQCASRPDDA
ncbi:YoaK family protein [Streptomyces sp. NPDC002573]|uniref:YoaK family protein n=1 Tax=Streptomyces sp. NPDC002573 TaxID=3364651 RepID=UPI0036945099